MKKICAAALVLAFLLTVLPLAVLKGQEGKNESPSETEAPYVPPAQDSFRILDMKTDTVTVMPAQEYLFGVVAAEMPISYEEEALKAQAVAAYTFACYRRRANRDRSYDLTTDSTLDQSFTERAKAKEKWGEKAEENEKKLDGILEEVKGQYLTYDGQPVLAVYHAISSGKTESSQTVWGNALPYLQPVSSPGDTLSPDYISRVTLSAEKLASLLSEECDLSGEEKEYFKNIKKTPSGTVKEVTVCGKVLSGSRIRSLLALRSAAFEIAYDKEFVFTVYGYGHGVGMSQYGAGQMAKQGSDYREILTHYYTGCTLEG